MESIIFEDYERAISASDLDGIEANYGITLPVEYRALLIRYNGGVPKDEVVFANGKKASVGGFYSVKYGELTIEEVIEDLQIVERHIPRAYIPIANTAFGNIYTISTMDKETGLIHRWDLDVGDIVKTTVASNLWEFLGGNL